MSQHRHLGALNVRYRAESRRPKRGAASRFSHPAAHPHPSSFSNRRSSRYYLGKSVPQVHPVFHLLASLARPPPSLAQRSERAFARTPAQSIGGRDRTCEVGPLPLMCSGSGPRSRCLPRAVGLLPTCQADTADHFERSPPQMCGDDLSPIAGVAGNLGHLTAKEMWGWLPAVPAEPSAVDWQRKSQRQSWKKHPSERKPPQK